MNTLSAQPGPAAATDADVPTLQDTARSNTATRPLALIADDSPFLALQLARLLADVGFHTQIASEAGTLRKLAPSAALICVELELFDACGFELTRELAGLCSCPLLLLTGTGRNTDLQWGLRAGARAVLSRPIRADVLRAALVGLGYGGPSR